MGEDQDRLLPDGEFLRRLSVCPRDMRIDFDTVPQVTVQAHDLLRCEITGGIGPQHDINRANVVQCVLDGVHASDASFSRSDFKDSAIRDSSFLRVNFHQAHLNTTTLVSCTFEECSLTLTNFNRSEFRDCRFVRCDLSDLLVKSCRFLGCEFTECTTTNKVFESCLLYDTHFTQTQLLLQSVIDNFGLEARLVEGDLLDGSPREGGRELSSRDLDAQTRGSDLSRLEQFRLLFYLEGLSHRTYAALDAGLSYEEWLRACRVSGAFATLVDSLCEFLAHLYQSDELIAHAFMKFHSLVSDLGEYLHDEAPRSEIYRAVAGVQVLSARIAEEYLDSLYDLHRSVDGDLVLGVQGPNDISFYRDRLPFLQGESSVPVVDLVERNSPFDLILAPVDVQSALTVLAFFLATRTELEIRRLGEAQPASLPASVERDDSAPSPSMPEVFSVRAGRGEDEGVLLELRLKALMPGTLLVDLKLDVSLEKAIRARDVMIDVVTRFRGTG